MSMMLASHAEYAAAATEVKLRPLAPPITKQLSFSSAAYQRGRFCALVAAASPTARKQSGRRAPAAARHQCQHRRATSSCDLPQSGLEVLYEEHGFRRYSSTSRASLSYLAAIHHNHAPVCLYPPSAHDIVAALWPSGPTAAGTFGNSVPRTKRRAQATLQLSAAPARMVVLVSAAPDPVNQGQLLGLYRLFINGVNVGIGPGRGKLNLANHPSASVYDRIEVPT